jgi:DNA helicase II / ATP-dependent DNA helicase PcrA
VSRQIFIPTAEQTAIVGSDDPVFARACPGAGKTRVLVERARAIVSNRTRQTGVAFLSFTRAAVWELENRLRADGLEAALSFPHFVGTFDSFIWQFLLMPFGAPGCAVKPKLIADKDEWLVKPFQAAQPLPISCFDRATGQILPAEARKLGFEVGARAASVPAYQTSATRTLTAALERGHLDFEDVRQIVHARLNNPAFAARVGPVLKARFGEIVVDEAQDCNPADLAIITWLRRTGITAKVVCDPEQAIYAFRGGVGTELNAFEATFHEDHRKNLTGNFRSTPAICLAVSALRRGAIPADEPLGRFKDDTSPVHLLAYKGGVSARIGGRFQGLVTAQGMKPSDCPVLASTIDSACKAIGQPPPGNSERMSVRLGEAVMRFQFAQSAQDRKDALHGVHAIILEIEGRLEHTSYRQYEADLDGPACHWHARILPIMRKLELRPGEDRTAWITRARTVLDPFVAGDRTIAQLLVNSGDLDAALVRPTASSSPARSIHSAKGLEFPGVCVVMTTTAKGILDFLDTGNPADKAEDTRKIYVAASRAERLLCIAIPSSQSARLKATLEAKGAAVQVVEIPDQ